MIMLKEPQQSQCKPILIPPGIHGCDPIWKKNVDIKLSNLDNRVIILEKLDHIKSITNDQIGNIIGGVLYGN